MADPVLLNNIDHGDLRVAPCYGAAFGDSVHFTIVFPTEFVEVQREYPILFRKGEDGRFMAVALLGFDTDENLFLDGEQWHARYVPVIHQRGPFLIGVKQREEGGQVVREPSIFFNPEDPRVSRTAGHPLFLTHGGQSPFLERMAAVLRVLHRGHELAGPMFDAFEAAGLIEPVALEVALDAHTVYKVPGMFTVSEERLAQLDGASLEQLNRSGFLSMAWYVAASLTNLNRLIELKNARRAVQKAVG